MTLPGFRQFSPFAATFIAGATLAGLITYTTSHAASRALHARSMKANAEGYLIWTCPKQEHAGMAKLVIDLNPLSRSDPNQHNKFHGYSHEFGSSITVAYASEHLHRFNDCILIRYKHKSDPPNDYIVSNRDFKTIFDNTQGTLIYTKDEPQL